MPYILIIDDLDTGFVTQYREYGKVVQFETEHQAVNQKYVLMDKRDNRNKRIDVQYVKGRK